MKRVQVQMLLMIVMLGAALPMHGMLARQLGRGKPPVSTATLLSKGVKIPTQRPIVVQPQIDTSTWLGWFRSLWQKSQATPVTPVVSPVSTSVRKTSPFSLVGQRMSYSTIVSQVANQNAPKVPVLLKGEVTSTDAQRESEDILDKLQGKNPWDYPMIKQIEEFLEKNNADAIEEVVVYLLSGTIRMRRPLILEEMVKKNNVFVAKVFPIIEKNADKANVWLLSDILLRLSPEQLLRAENMINKFFMNEHPVSLVKNHEPEFIAKLLPKDTTKFIRIMRTICTKMKNIIFINHEEQKRYDRLVQFLTTIFAEKFAKGTDDDFKELIEALFQEALSGVDQENLFVTLTLSDSRLKNTVAEYIKKEQTAIELLCKNQIGINMLEKIYSKGEVKKIIVDYLKKETDSKVVSLAAIDYLVGILNVPDFLETVLGADSNYAQTPSYRHLEEFSDDIFRIDVSAIASNGNFKHMIRDILAKEKELIDNGYEVFYHGRRWEHNFFTAIYMMLYSYKTGKKPEDFAFLHYDDPVLGKVSERFFDSEEKKRKLLIAKGTELPFTTELKEALGVGRSTLFLAKYLFGNLAGKGCCPIYLVLKNFNWGKGEFSIKEIFSMFGYSDVYKIHEQKLSELQLQHDKLSPYGELVQIAIPKNNLDKCVYPSAIGYHAQKKEIDIPGVGKTTDINKIVDHADKEPQDSLELILSMTRDKFGGLNPESGIKTFFYNSVDPAKMTAFKQGEKIEFAAIEKDLEQKDAQKKGIEIEKE